MCDGRLFGAGSHPQRPQEVVDQDVELLDVLGLGLQHAEHHLVPLAHAVGVGRPDVVLDDGLPLPPAQPAPQEALHLGEQGLGVKGRAGGRAGTLPGSAQSCVCVLPRPGAALNAPGWESNSSFKYWHRLPHPYRVQGKVGWGLGQAGTVEGVPAHRG